MTINYHTVKSGALNRVTAPETASIAALTSSIVLLKPKLNLKELFASDRLRPMAESVSEGPSTADEQAAPEEAQSPGVGDAEVSQQTRLVEDAGR